MQVIIANLLAGLALGYVMKAGGVELADTPYMVISYLVGFGLFNIGRWLL